MAINEQARLCFGGKGTRHMWGRQGQRIVLLGLGLMVAASNGCQDGGSGHATERPEIAVTNTYLGAAVRDLAGASTPILELAGPGMCPGHFDLSPGQMSRLRRCRLMLRFDFQQGLEDRLRRTGHDRPEVRAVVPKGGLGVPGTYARVCSQVADALVAMDLLAPRDAQARLAVVARRIEELHGRVRSTLAQNDVAGLAVVASAHQEGLCRWLGLAVAGTFSSSDETRVGEIRDALAAGADRKVKLVIANRPEGRQLADALAEALEVGVVVFDNFPSNESSASNPSRTTTQGAEVPAFDAMLLANVSRLIEGAAP